MGLSMSRAERGYSMGIALSLVIFFNVWERKKLPLVVVGRKTLRIKIPNQRNHQTPIFCSLKLKCLSWL